MSPPPLAHLYPTPLYIYNIYTWGVVGTKTAGDARVCAYNQIARPYALSGVLIQLYLKARPSRPHDGAADGSERKT